MGNRPKTPIPHAIPDFASSYLHGELSEIAHTPCIPILARSKLHGIKPDFTLSHAYPNSTESMQETGDEAGSFQTQAVHERI